MNVYVALHLIIDMHVSSHLTYLSACFSVALMGFCSLQHFDEKPGKI